MDNRLHPDSAGARSESTQYEAGLVRDASADRGPSFMTTNIRGGSHGLGVPYVHCGRPWLPRSACGQRHR